MRFHHFFRRPRSQAQLGNERGGRRVKPKRPAAPPLCLEPLEDRSLLSFLAPVNYATGMAPDAVAVGDFNGDGKLDLVVANAGSNTVSVFLGNGDGTFQAARNYAVGGSPRSVAVGDFNRDGKLDIVTANSSGSDVSVLLGNGDGTFQTAHNFSIGGSTSVGSVAVGDFNGDGKLDLAVGSSTNIYIPPNPYCYGSPYVCGPFRISSWHVSILLGHGDGTFSNASTVSVGPFSELTAADFNGDGKLDLATNGGQVLLGNGDGTIQALRNGPSGNSILAGDVNSDGKPDLITTNGSNTVSVALGNGDGTFQTAANYATGLNPAAVAVGDFNGNGKLDIVTANGGSKNVSVLLGNGNGTFLTALNFAAGSGPSSVAVGDFNGDHFPDLAVANQGSNNVSVLINAADWSKIGAATHFDVGGFPSPTTAGAAGNFTVSARDASGNLVPSYTGTVHFTSSDSQAVLPANYTFTTADHGVHNFTAILKTAGTQSITVADTVTAGLRAAETGITVNPAAASRFVISAPHSVNTGVPFSLTIKVEDAFGNVVTDYTDTVHFRSTDKAATLPADYTFTAADKGVHTFTGVVLRTTGSQTITVTDTLVPALIDDVIIKVR